MNDLLPAYNYDLLKVIAERDAALADAEHWKSESNITARSWDILKAELDTALAHQQTLRKNSDNWMKLSRTMTKELAAALKLLREAPNEFDRPSYVMWWERVQELLK